MSQSDTESESDFVDSLIERHQEDTADHLNRRMREAQGIKAVEEASSQRRLEAMWALENERQRAVAEAKAEQQLREKLLLRYVLIGAAVIIIAVIVLSVVLASVN
jgi:hypothetical protein